MDYGALISQAWRLTWRHRFLWILGLFATTTVGSCSGGSSGLQWRTDAPDMERAMPGADRAAGDVWAWVLQNWGLVTALVVVAAIFGVVVLILSLIAQGAMAKATSDLALGRTASLGQAWDAGLRLFWRYAGLWLVLIVFGILVAIVVGVVAAGLFFGALFGGDARGPLAVFGVILAFLFALVAIPVAVGTTIVVAYAQRAIALEDIGPWDALGVGLRLLRRRLGTSLVLWLITFGLTIAFAIGLGILAVILLIPLGGLGALLFVTTGVTAGSIAYAVLALVVFVLAMWLLAGVVNTYFWNLWTLAYLNLTGRLQPATPPAAQ